MVLLAYGLIYPPSPPYTLILLSCLSGVSFNVLWVSPTPPPPCSRLR